MIKTYKLCIVVIIIIFSSYYYLFSYEKRKKIYIIKSNNFEQYNESYDGFIKGFEKSKIKFESKIYNLGNSKQSYIAILNEILHNKPDLIHTIGTKASQKISSDIKNIPIIFSMVLNPAKQGLINDMPQLKSNLSGIKLDIPIATQFHTLKQIFRYWKKIAVLYHSNNDLVYIKEVSKIAKKYSVTIIAKKINSEDKIPIALKNLQKESNVLWLIPDPLITNYNTLTYILMFCISNNFPVIGLSEYHLKAGCIMALRPDYYEIGKQASELALQIMDKNYIEKQKILNPRKTKLFINKRAADMMGIEIPNSILLNATQIFE